MYVHYREASFILKTIMNILDNGIRFYRKIFKYVNEMNIKSFYVLLHFEINNILHIELQNISWNSL